MNSLKVFLNLVLFCSLNSQLVNCVFNSGLPSYITPEEFARVQGVKILPSEIPLPPYGQKIPSLPNPKPGFGPRLWTNAEVPYTLDPSFSEEQREQIAIAFNAYHEDTCIRFIPKEDQHTSWVDILHDEGVCGLAHVCMNNGAQFAKFGGNCINAGTIVHELGHTLCMGHEHTRQDRDSWITFNSSICEPNPADDDDFRGGLNKMYDYLSSQHYEGECYNGCIQPILPGVTKCGSGGPLSVLDIEALNEMYGCDSGCFGYRYVSSRNVSLETLVPIGNGTATDNPFYYGCRAYVHGDIIPGHYDESYRENCRIIWNDQVYTKSGVEGDVVEVLTIPNNETSSLEWVNTGGPVLPPNAVKGGRTNEREPIYVIKCKYVFDLIGQPHTYWLPGKFQPSKGAFYEFGFVEECHDEIEFLTCNKN